MILLTDEEILEQDIELKAGILAHHALDVKNGRDPTLRTSKELFERRQVARAQLKKVVRDIDLTTNLRDCGAVVIPRVYLKALTKAAGLNDSEEAGL